MANTGVGIPMVEVVRPGGKTELWAAALAHDQAVAAVQSIIPADCNAKLSYERLLVNTVLKGLRHGEVRKVWP